MGVFLVLISALMWSFVSVLVKVAAGSFDSFTIMFSRFFFGIVCLGLWIVIRRGSLAVLVKHRWIWYGALGKSLNYLFEVLGIMAGHAYMQVLVMPMITVFMFVASVVYFKEKFTLNHLISAAACIVGVCMISWNGLPLSEFSGSNLLVTGLFAIAAVGACFHFLSQKILIDQMSSQQMNWSVFVLATFMTALPLPYTFEVGGEFSVLGFVALFGLGAITGISFFVYGIGVKKVSFMTASILVNAGVLFTLLWSRMFMDEPIGWVTVAGCLLAIFGMVWVNLPLMKRRRLTKSGAASG